MPFPINCKTHTNQPIQRVDPNLSVKKHLYCFECMLESEDPKSLYATLPKLSQFLDTISTPLPGAPETVDGPKIPAEYLEVLCHQKESQGHLAQHIIQEKERIVNFFEEIKKALNDTVEALKYQHLKSLDDQFANLEKYYQYFEKELKKAYNEAKEPDFFFPTVQELSARLGEIRHSSDLHDFVEYVKCSLKTVGLSLSNQGEEKKKWYFDNMVKTLKTMQTARPAFEGKDTNVHIIRDDVGSHLQKLIEIMFNVKSSALDITFTPNLTSESSSSIASPREFLMIKQWLPSKFDFTPKLLYRGSRDGFSPETFHSKCDGKGATITLIKCCYGNKSQEAIIGGFLDESWHSNKNGSYIFSDEAFLFSLTAQTKFSIDKKRLYNAAYGFSDYGPTFGGHDICIAKDLTRCFSRPYAYTNSAQLLPGEGTTKEKCLYFTTKDIEVYSLH